MKDIYYKTVKDFDQDTGEFIDEDDLLDMEDDYSLIDRIIYTEKAVFDAKQTTEYDEAVENALTDIGCTPEGLELLLEDLDEDEMIERMRRKGYNMILNPALPND